jgi:hypothetical protein
MPSPAIFISIIALIFAVGGGYAIAKKKQSPKKIANNVVTKRAPGLSVLHAKTADNATSASSVNGAGVFPINFNTNGTSVQTLLDQNNLQLVASCTGGSFDFLEVRSNANGGTFHSEVVDVEDALDFYDFDNNFDSGDSTDLLAQDGPTDKNVFITYNNAAGRGVTVHLGVGSEGNFGCSVIGDAITD